MKKKIVSVALTLAMAAGTLSNLGVTAYAAKTVEIPEPKAAYDFSYNFEELAEKYPGFSVVENDAAPVLVEDESMGQVLQLKKAIIENRVFVKKADGTETAYIESEDTQYSQIDIANPYQGLDYLKEYEPYEDVDQKIYRNCSQPYWKEGITISYWIKTPAGEDGFGLNSNVVGFESDRFQAQADDYAKHLCTVKFDLEYNSMTDAEREATGNANVIRCGVLPGSDFYFEYESEEEYLGGPMYYYDSSNKFMGRIYWMNKFFKEGHYRDSSGKIVTAGQAGRYAEWVEAPRFGDTEDDHDPGNSAMRYTWTHSEMWLDASSSFFFENDSENVNKQLNPNHVTSYDTRVGVMHNDSFNINSWKGASTVAEADDKGMAGPSPVTAPDEWHMVTCVIQNDWVLYYLDGEEIDIEEYYSSFGTNGLAEPSGNYKPWKRFNKGTGSRYGYGSNKTVTYWCYYGNYVAPTMMEWIIKDCVTASIGGGNTAGDGYLMMADTDEIQLKNVIFYDKILDEDQIEFLYENPQYYSKGSGDTDPTPGPSDDPIVEVLLGDTDLDGDIDATDALCVLQHAASLKTLEGDALANADVDADGKINATDALNILKYAAKVIDAFTPVAAE